MERTERCVFVQSQAQEFPSRGGADECQYKARIRFESGGVFKQNIEAANRAACPEPVEGQRSSDRLRAHHSRNSVNCAGYPACSSRA